MTENHCTAIRDQTSYKKSYLIGSKSARKRGRLHQTLLETIVRKLVPKRIWCSEPRVCKRRPKAYPSMQQPRQVLRHKGCTA